LFAGIERPGSDDAIVKSANKIKLIPYAGRLLFSIYVVVFAPAYLLHIVSLNKYVNGLFIVVMIVLTFLISKS
jgi:hypothetical protein